MPKYKHGKQKHGIDLATFNRLLEKVDKPTVNKYGYDSLFIKSLLALLYWLGIRKTEAIGSRSHKYVLKPCKRRPTTEVKYTRAMPGIWAKDIHVEGEWLCIEAEARKHGSREGALRLPLTFPFVDLIVQQWKRTGVSSRVWPIPEVTSWRIMKQLDAKKYLHFFRFNRITELCSNPNISMAEICSWTGLTPQTINDYMERSERFIKTAAEKMKLEYQTTQVLQHD